MKVAALGVDRWPRFLSLWDGLRENGVEISSLRESRDQDRAMEPATLHLTIVFAEVEADMAWKRTLGGWSTSRPPASSSGGASPR